MNSGRISAVLFDLFGTLVPGGTSRDRDLVSVAMAGDLGVDPAAFTLAMRETYDPRARGELGDLGATVSTMAARLGARPPAAAIERAAWARLDFTRELFDATWALPLLDQVRSAGLATAVISDCSAEVPILWPDTELSKRFDAVSFSCVLGVRKPAPRMYLSATGQLGVTPGECVFVGDGASSELSGARALGMRAIWFDDVDGEGTERPDHEVGWDGERITDVNDLAGLLSL